jgi:hypothetical protein
LSNHDGTTKIFDTIKDKKTLILGNKEECDNVYKTIEEKNNSFKLFGLKTNDRTSSWATKGKNLNTKSALTELGQSDPLCLMAHNIHIASPILAKVQHVVILAKKSLADTIKKKILRINPLVAITVLQKEQTMIKESTPSKPNTKEKPKNEKQVPTSNQSKKEFSKKKEKGSKETPVTKIEEKKIETPTSINVQSQNNDTKKENIETKPQVEQPKANVSNQTNPEQPKIPNHSDIIKAIKQAQQLKSVRRELKPLSRAIHVKPATPIVTRHSQEQLDALKTIPTVMQVFSTPVVSREQALETTEELLAKLMADSPPQRVEKIGARSIRKRLVKKRKLRFPTSASIKENELETVNMFTSPEHMNILNQYASQFEAQFFKDSYKFKDITILTYTLFKQGKRWEWFGDKYLTAMLARFLELYSYKSRHTARITSYYLGLLFKSCSANITLFGVAKKSGIFPYVSLYLTDEDRDTINQFILENETKLDRWEFDEMNRYITKTVPALKHVANLYEKLIYAVYKDSGADFNALDKAFSSLYTYFRLRAPVILVREGVPGYIYREAQDKNTQEWICTFVKDGKAYTAAHTDPAEAKAMAASLLLHDVPLHLSQMNKTPTTG